MDRRSVGVILATVLCISSLGLAGANVSVSDEGVIKKLGGETDPALRSNAADGNLIGGEQNETTTSASDGELSGEGTPGAGGSGEDTTGAGGSGEDTTGAGGSGEDTTGAGG
ncbi:hypothetical protein ACFOZ7_12025, partial [Natribaculum luteum]